MILNGNAELLGTNDLKSNPNFTFSPLNETSDDEIQPYLGVNINCDYFSEEDFLNKFSPCKNASIMSLNIDGLANKHSQLADYLNFFLCKNFFFDIICLQEVNDIADPSLISLPNYSQLIFKKRTSRRKGGVGCFISSHLNFKICEELSIFEEGVIEMLAVEVEFSKHNKILVLNLYKPPNLSSEQHEIFFNKIESILEIIDTRGQKCVIAGDFNLCLLKHEQFRATEDFINLMFSFGSLQLIKYPTRVSNQAGHSSASLIDQIWTNLLKDSYQSGILKAYLSDHFPIFSFLEFQSKKSTPPSVISTRSFTEQNITNFKNELELLSFDELLNDQDAQSSYNTFHSMFFNAYERHFPIKTTRFNKNIHKKEKWMTQGLLTSRRSKLRFANQKAENPTPMVIQQFKDYKNLYNRLIRLAKKDYYDKLLIQCQGDTKKSWSIYREISGLSKKKDDLTNILKSDGNDIIGDFNLAQRFNEHFSNVTSNIQEKIVPTVRPPESYLEESDLVFEFLPVSPELVIETFNELKIKKSTDYTGLSTFFLKKVIHFISTPLAHIFNRSLETGIVPEQCKIAKVTPIFKQGGDELNVNDYRPISLLSIFSKILEKLVAKNLKEFLISNEILSDYQFGFQDGNSTSHPMMHLLNRVGQAMNNNEYTVAVFLDLSKAFDCIPVNGILKKLQKIGIHGNKLKWFENYLFRRRQFVQIRNEKSNYSYITSGVPQGSILGPILFLIFINDIANATLLYVLLFADDTTLLSSGKNLHELVNFVNEELRKISQWFRANKMLLHPIKTKFTIFHQNPDSIQWDEINIFLDENDLEANVYDEKLKKRISYVNHASDIPAIKFLGIYFDPKLDFKYHISQLNTKLSRSLFILRRSKNFLSEKALKALYYSTFHCHITYGILIYSCVYKSSLQAIIKKQKAAIRILAKAKFNAHTSPLFKTLKILPLESLIDYFSLQFFHDFKIGLTPRSFHNCWQTVGQVNNRYQLRNENEYVVPRFRTTQIRMFPLWSLPSKWNELDNTELKSLVPRNSFNVTLKKSLLNSLPSECTIENCQICINNQDNI